LADHADWAAILRALPGPRKLLLLRIQQDHPQGFRSTSMNVCLDSTILRA